MYLTFLLILNDFFIVDMIQLMVQHMLLVTINFLHIQDAFTQLSPKLEDLCVPRISRHISDVHPGLEYSLFCMQNHLFIHSFTEVERDPPTSRPHRNCYSWSTAPGVYNCLGRCSGGIDSIYLAIQMQIPVLHLITFGGRQQVFYRGHFTELSKPEINYALALVLSFY